MFCAIACHGHVHAMPLRIDRDVSLRLDPLAACNQSVASEFIRLAARLRLLPRQSTQAAAMVPTKRPLEMFFPFDPYLLPRSARFLKLQVNAPIHSQLLNSNVIRRASGATHITCCQRLCREQTQCTIVCLEQRMACQKALCYAQLLL